LFCKHELGKKMNHNCASIFMEAGEGLLPVENSQYCNEYLFKDTGVKKIKWTLPLTSCLFQPRVADGHGWLEIAPSER